MIAFFEHRKSHLHIDIEKFLADLIVEILKILFILILR